MPTAQTAALSDGSLGAGTRNKQGHGGMRGRGVYTKRGFGPTRATARSKATTPQIPSSRPGPTSAGRADTARRYPIGTAPKGAPPNSRATAYAAATNELSPSQTWIGGIALSLERIGPVT
jgi:hypothetical protein